MGDTEVISLGGSIVAPKSPDAAAIDAFAREARHWLAGSASRRLVVVVGGGGPARDWQAAYRALCPAPGSDSQDWIGIMATRLNAELVRQVLSPECAQPVVTDPTADFGFEGRVLVGAGWKPGFSTDFDAVCLASRFGARRGINLSNIEKVYTADPKLDPKAKPIDAISWKEFRALVGNEWKPGANLPFDPIASAKAEAEGIRVVCASGKDMANLRALLEGRDYVGSAIG